MHSSKRRINPRRFLQSLDGATGSAASVTLCNTCTARKTSPISWAELAICFGVILRKVWGGSRTWAGAGAIRADVGLADVLAAGAFGPGLPQSTAAGPAGGVGLAPVNYRAFSLASPAGRGRIPAADSELPEARTQHGPNGQRPPHAQAVRAWSSYPGRVGLTRWSG